MMFLTIQIDDGIVAMLYREGWDILSSIISAEQKKQLIKLLTMIMDEPVIGYTPNIYYTKGMEVERAIKGSKLLYYFAENATPKAGVIY